MYVGVILIYVQFSAVWQGIPHVCGGDPLINKLPVDGRVVFPMYVGVILVKKYGVSLYNRIPHVCGGDPMDALNQILRTLYSPCMWG